MFRAMKKLILVALLVWIGVVIARKATQPA
jgi:hypothetical protein